MSRVRLDGATFNVQDEGTGPPVLLLHGFPTTHRLWRAVLPQLVTAGCRAVAPDLAGYGLSDADSEADIGMARQARWMIELAEALGLERPLLVAHDVGSAAAEIVAARSPERIRGLVIIDGVYEENWAMEAVASIQSWNESEAHRLFPVLVRRLRSNSASGGRISEEIAREVLAPYEGAEGGLRLVRAARALNPKDTAEISEQLRTRPVPALVLWGESDRYLSVDEVARPLAEMLGAELRLVSGGHFLPLDAPDEVAREILAFLNRLGR
jgi:2-hydroxymuconate-semialdehyde hydrolase